MKILLFLSLLLIFNLNLGAQEYVELSKEKDCFVQNGKRFYSIGINAVKIADDPAHDPKDPYYDQRAQGEEKWAEEVAQRFNDWDFNTIGPFSSEFLHKKFLYTTSIYFGNYTKGCPHILADVFDQEYAEMADRYARIECNKRATDKNLIGYFAGNEPKIFGLYPWARHQNSLVEIYLKLPVNSPGYMKVKEFLLKTQNLNYDEQCDLWAAIVMDKYMEICTQAIKRYDSNHLILGVRFSAIPPDEVVKAVARYSDVISFNLYENDFSLLDRWYKLTGRPILITEFSWRSLENLSGNSNLNGPNVTVNTDKDRAENYREYLGKVIKRSGKIIGLQWFQYFDEPPNSGRGNDEECGSFGLVSINNQIYLDLTAAMTEMNKKWQNSLTK